MIHFSIETGFDTNNQLISTQVEGTMKRKILSTVLAVAMVATLLTGCGTNNTPVTNDGGNAAEVVDAVEAPTELSGTLNIWAFTVELQTMAVAFQEKYPDVDVQYTMIPMTDGEYQTKVKAASTTDDCPDVVGLEASFVREWVESSLLADLSDLAPLAEELQTYQSVLDVGTYDGEIRAYSYQATPGAVFYRRSLAKEYFGTDDPTEIQAMMSDMTKFQEMAATVKEKSNGDTYMVCSTGDFTNTFYANREQPWVVDGALVIDPQVDSLFEIAKTFRTEGYEAQAEQWAEGWYAGMSDSLVDAQGAAKQVFCYFLPTWGLPYVLMPNAGDTAGDWACVSGPLPYQWGGTWVGAMENSPNAEIAKAFVQFCALDEENLTNWATGVYTHEYLVAIDPSIGDDQAQGAGDFVSSKKVVDQITASFSDSGNSEFLAGQNSYEGFAAAAPSVSAVLMQGSDDAIQRALNDPLNNYVTGVATKEEAITQFKEAVSSEFPELIIE